MKTMAYDVVADTLVAVQTNKPPTDEEWEASLVRMAKRDFKRKLVWTLGASPSSKQRQRARQVLGDETEPLALITSSAAARAVLGIMGLFFKNMKAFSPEHVDAGMAFLGVPTVDRPTLLSTASRLFAEIGIKLQLPTPDVVASVSNPSGEQQRRSP